MSLVSLSLFVEPFSDSTIGYYLERNNVDEESALMTKIRDIPCGPKRTKFSFIRKAELSGAIRASKLIPSSHLLAAGQSLFNAL